MNSRIQLTLFIDEEQAKTIEEVRKRFNPEQYRLIRSHVTLCREDELPDITMIQQKLETINHPPVTINFGSALRFADEKGVLIPAEGNNQPFDNLRKLILNGVIENPGYHQPHITLMHPRNSTCTDAIFNQIQNFMLPSRLEFYKISLIQQENNMPWTILQEFRLGVL